MLSIPFKQQSNVQVDMDSILQKHLTYDTRRISISQNKIMFMLLKLNLETFTLDFCQIEQLITCLQAPGPQEMTSFYFIIHNFGILLRRHILTIFVSICDPAYVMINDVMMSRMRTLCEPWSCLFLCSCSRVVDIWHLMCGWWSMLWTMGKYYYLHNNLLFPDPYVS